jgi:hypothetical protein
MGLAPVAGAAGPELKPGLWERTVTMQSGMPDLSGMPGLDQLPPEQRAQVEKMMAAMAGKPTTVRECVTPEMVKEWENYARGRTENGCTQTVTEQSPQRVVMTMSCDGGASSGTAEFNARGPEHMTGVINMVHRTKDGERRMKIDMTSRWLAAECGDVRPDTPTPVSSP